MIFVCFLPFQGSEVGDEHFLSRGTLEHMLICFAYRDVRIRAGGWIFMILVNFLPFHGSEDGVGHFLE